MKMFKQRAVHFDFPSLALRLKKLWAPLRRCTRSFDGECQLAKVSRRSAGSRAGL